jgi:hypothetical protein
MSTTLEKTTLPDLGSEQWIALTTFRKTGQPVTTPVWFAIRFGTIYVETHHERQQMLGLLHQNVREWREIARLDNSYENYREIVADVLLMYGGKSDSKAVNLAMEQLATILPHSETKGFPKLDHFGIERTAPREVARQSVPTF